MAPDIKIGPTERLADGRVYTHLLARALRARHRMTCTTPKAQTLAGQGLEHFGSRNLFRGEPLRIVRSDRAVFASDGFGHRAGIAPGRR